MFSMQKDVGGLFQVGYGINMEQRDSQKDNLYGIFVRKVPICPPH
jgi:hypothetical protein